MPIDNQTFDFDKDPAVLAAEKFSADGQINISAKISPEVAKQQAAFAELREEIQNGAVTFASTILKLAVPAAQAGEKTKGKDNGAIEKFLKSLPDIEPLPDNPNHQTMVKKLAEIEARAQVLQPQGQKLTNPEYRKYFFAEMKKLFASCKELRINLKNSRGKTLLYRYIAKIFEQDIIIINKLRDYLEKAIKTEKSTEKVKKWRKKAKDELRDLYAKGYTRDRIMKKYREAGLTKSGTEFLISVLDEMEEEDQKK